MLGRATHLREEFDREALPHLDALYGMALRLTRSPGDAEDLVQEAILRAYRFWGRYERGTNCKAWLFKILTNTFINRYHERRRDRELALMMAAEEGAPGSPAPGRPRDPEEVVATAGLSDDVLRALLALPSDYRLAVLLCDLEELSYREIADILGCPIGTVMSRLFRGRRLLQKALKPYAIEQGIVAADEAAPIDLAAYRKRKP